ncbi:MAG: FAD-linked oxidase C-terminal domain-containing protein [Promethearchaeota archaeon]
MSLHSKQISKDIIKALSNIVGPENLTLDLEVRWTYAFGGSIFVSSWIPDVVIMPETTNQVSSVLRIANENKIPVVARGSGTSLSSGHLASSGGILLDLSKMNRIILIDIKNNLAIVEPGVICDDLNKKLIERGYFFPPDPGSSSICTIGGMVATNAGGIQAFKYGVTRDYVLKLEVVMANGTIINFGSEVLKSVSSYNIKDLFVGSEGTLGIITKIFLKIRPYPKERKLGLYIFRDMAALMEAVISLRKEAIVPCLMEFLDEMTAEKTFEFLGGEFLDYPKGNILLAEVDGFNPSEVNEDFKKMNETIIKKQPLFSIIAENLDEREKLIHARKAALPALARIGPTCCLEDCSVKITNLGEVVEKISKIPESIGSNRIMVATFGHLDGNIHPTFLFNENDPKDVADFEKAMDFLYKKIILPARGSVTGEHGIGRIKSSYIELEHGKEVVKIMNDLKKTLDPNMILNPGVGKGGNKVVIAKRTFRTLINLPNKTLKLNCIRCGFCNSECPSRINYKYEAFTPRGRLSLLNGIIFGEIKLENSGLINKIFHTCILCGNCQVTCPAGVPIIYIFEKIRELLH